MSVFSRSIEARILELGICMDDKFWSGVIENQAQCCYSFIHISSFLSFHGKFVSQFSQELLKLESSTLVSICRVSDCIMGSRLKVIALILLFLSIFGLGLACQTKGQCCHTKNSTLAKTFTEKNE